MIDDLTRRGIAEYVRKNGASIAAAARRFRVSWHTARKAASQEPKAPRRVTVSKAVRRRRCVVSGLAGATKLQNGRKIPLYPSCPSIRSALAARRISCSESTVRRDLLGMGFVNRVRRKHPLETPSFCFSAKSSRRRWRPWPTHWCTVMSTLSPSMIFRGAACGFVVGVLRSAANGGDYRISRA